MELALRRGLGATLTKEQCYADTQCRVASDLVCYTSGYFTDFCKGWRAFEPGASAASGIPMPANIAPPVIDSNPASPTYGQAMIDGHVVDTSVDAQRLIDQQIAASAAADRGAISRFFGDQSDANCALKRDECGMFTSLNADCTDCIFDPLKPAFLIAAFVFVALMVAKPWK